MQHHERRERLLAGIRFRPLTENWHKITQDFCCHYTTPFSPNKIQTIMAVWLSGTVDQHIQTHKFLTYSLQVSTPWN